MTDRDHPALSGPSNRGDDPDADVLPDPILGAAPAVPPASADLAQPAAADAGDAGRGEAARPDAMVPGPPEEPTVGTGSVFAIGCGAATLLFVVIAILVALWMR